MLCAASNYIVKYQLTPSCKLAEKVADAAEKEKKIILCNPTRREILKTLLIRVAIKAQSDQNMLSDTLASSNIH